MTSLLRILALSLLLSSCSGIATQISSGPVQEDPTSRSLGERLDDRMLKTKAAINLKAEAGLADTHIETYSYESTIILIGQVQKQSQLALANKALKPLRDLKTVKNLLTVGENISFNRAVRDNLLETKIKTKLLTNDEDSLSNIKVVVENGSVYLYGLATRKQAQLATALARESRGTKAVVQIFSYIN